MYATGDGRSDLIEIPIVLVLWAYENYVGVKRQFVRDEPNLAAGWTSGAHCEAGADFDNRAASAVVYPGPDYDNWKARNGGQEPTVLLWTHQWCGPDGFSIALQRGAYPDLRALGFQDDNAKNPASSVDFFDPTTGSVIPQPLGAAVNPLVPLPLVLRMHTATYFESPLGYTQAINRCPLPEGEKQWEKAYCAKIDTALTVVESFDSYDNVYSKGTDTDEDDYYLGKISWIEVLRGPDWRVESEVVVFDQEHFGGNYVKYSAPNDIELDQMPSGFGDTIRSVQINP